MWLKKNNVPTILKSFLRVSKQVYVYIIENNKKIHRASIVGDNEIVNYMYVKVGHNGPVALLRTSLNNPCTNLGN